MKTFSVNLSLLLIVFSLSQSACSQQASDFSMPPPPSPNGYPRAKPGQVLYVNNADLPQAWQEYENSLFVRDNAERKKRGILNAEIKPGASSATRFIASYDPFLKSGFGAVDRAIPISTVPHAELNTFTFKGFLARQRVADKGVVQVGRVWQKGEMRVLLEEWDFSKNDVGVVVIVDALNEDVNGVPARFVAIVSDDGNLRSNLNWVTPQRKFELNIESRADQFAVTKALALSIALSIVPAKE
jgi:hypothetical protein